MPHSKKPDNTAPQHAWFGKGFMLSLLFCSHACISIHDTPAPAEIQETTDIKQTNTDDKKSTVTVFGQTASLVELDDNNNNGAFVKWQNLIKKHNRLAESKQGKASFDEWMEKISFLKNKPLREKASIVDAYVDRFVKYEWDTPYQLNTGEVVYDDYWSDATETIQSKTGDCEDIAILKYFTLQALGVPTEKMYLLFVDSKGEGLDHIVLALNADEDSSYYNTPDNECIEGNFVILNNDRLYGILVPEKNLKYKFQYAMNTDGFWSIDATHDMDKLNISRPGNFTP